jgi:hypothetical protein
MLLQATAIIYSIRRFVGNLLHLHTSARVKMFSCSVALLVHMWADLPTRCQHAATSSVEL